MPLNTTCLEQKSMQEKAEKQKEVIRCVHVFTLNANNTRTPQRTYGLLVHIIPRKTTELENVLHQNHHL